MAITVRGSQHREGYKEGGYVGYMLGQGGSAFLIDEEGTVELWQSNNDHAGYTVEIEGLGYEFVRTLYSAPNAFGRLRAHFKKGIRA